MNSTCIYCGHPVDDERHGPEGHRPVAIVDYGDLLAQAHADREERFNARMPLKTQRKDLSPERIVETVARYYGILLDQIKGKARNKQVVLPRQIAMYLMHEETEAPLLRIGEALGGRDHSTVLHGCEKIEREMAENDDFRRDIGALREMLYAEYGSGK